MTAISAQAPTNRLAAIAQDVRDGEVWRIKSLAPLHEHPVQQVTISRPGSLVGRTVTARQTAIGHNTLHRPPHSLA
jgi:hypothetical protein